MADAFLSYSHIDNQPFGPKELRWVEAFHNHIRTRLQMKLGARQLDIWYDARLTGNEPFSPDIQAALDRSKLLVAVVSNGYLKSDWCPRELHRFAGRTDRQGLIFNVLKEPVQREELPAPLRGMNGYEFYRRDGDRTRPLWQSTEDYWDRIEDIAEDFTRKLQAVAPAPKGHVFLPDLSWDAADARDELKRELEALRYACHREPHASAQLAVFIVGPERAALPDGALPKLVWIAPGASGTHVERLKAEAGKGYELLTGLKAELKNHVLSRLEPKPAAASKPPGRLYLIAQTQVEIDAARVVLPGVAIDVPLFAGTPEEIREEHKACLQECE